MTLPRHKKVPACCSDVARMLTGSFPANMPSTHTMAQALSVEVPAQGGVFCQKSSSPTDAMITSPFKARSTADRSFLVAKSPDLSPNLCRNGGSRRTAPDRNYLRRLTCRLWTKNGLSARIPPPTGGLPQHNLGKQTKAAGKPELDSGEGSQQECPPRKSKNMQSAAPEDCSQVLVI